MKFFSKATVAFTVVVACFASPLGDLVVRTVAEIRADIATLTTQATTLDTQITAYPTSGGTLAGALAIHQSGVAILNTLRTSITHAQNTPTTTEAEARGILDALLGLEPIIDHALVQIIAKEAAFRALPLGGVPNLVLQDLRFLNGNITIYSNELILKSPTAALKAEGTALRDRIGSDFAAAITAYESNP